MKKIFFLISVCCAGYTAAQAQEVISGKIQNPAGKGLAGIAVVAAGSTDTVRTGAGGKFALNVPALPVKLLLHGNHYLFQEVQVTSNDFLTLIMKNQGRELQEVKVSSPILKHAASNFDVVEVEGAKLQYTFEANPVNALRARVPGLQMSATAGGVTSGTNMVIRGMKSVVGSNQPLFVLDGIPIENETSGANQFGGQDWGNSLKELNAYDIASVTVLKGAAAVSRYGARGLNGVIALTTQTATGNKGWHFEVNGGYSMGEVYSAPSLISPQVARESGDPKLAFLANASNNYLHSFQRANAQLGNVVISRVTDKGKYRLSYTGDYNKGTYYGNTLDKHNIMFRADNQWSRKWRTQAGVIYNHSTARNAPSIGAQKFASLGNAFIEYPTDFNPGANRDPLESETAWWLYGQNAAKKNQTLRAYLQSTWELSPYLQLVANGSYSTYRTRTDEHATGYMERLLGKESLYHQEKAYRNNAKEYTNDYLAKLQLNYQRQFGEMGIKASAAYDFWHTNGGIRGTAFNAADPNAARFETGNEWLTIQRYNDASALKEAAYFDVRNANQKTIHGALLALEVSWFNKLFLTGTARMDNITTIPDLDPVGKLRYLYPSVGASYVMQQDLRRWTGAGLHWLDAFKLRANAGRTGNVTGLFHYASAVTGDMELPYPTHRTLYKPYYTSNGNWGMRNYQTGFSIENAWEYELGAEFSVLNDRIGGSVTWYNRNTENKLYDIVAPLSVYNKPLRYVTAAVKNQGWEIQLNAVPVLTKDFKWTTTLNFAANRNRFGKITASGSDQLSLGASQQDVSLMGTLQGSFGTLLSSYAHKYNGDGQPLLDAALQYVPSGVPVKIGDATPSWIGGWENSVEFKGFRLSCLLDVKMGGDVWSGTYALLYQRGALENTAFGRTAGLGGIRRMTKTWHTDPETGKNVVVYRETYDGIAPKGVFDGGVTLYGKDVSGLTFQQAQEAVGRDEKGEYRLQPLAASDYYAGFHDRAGVKDEAVFENSYIALREVSLSYKLPNKLADCRIGVTGRNLGYLYRSLPYGLNPDGSYNNRNGGAFEYAALLPVRTWGAFIQLRF
ncbi:TonB-dependent receptor plug domain-containing protein [Chitinophaga nivalis]|uniref:TonB-dependent receptor plug domain-containing protein n=1 Tax=Chitinophaga nivalis TaxID=2991709 RepID=A0ABT3IGA3_9BACT|nr:TonB-dependent receptor plug domain-containing protein [Chitinophaga nivalis]MCW3467325.1 TonB-dependent receptor plug domain-containing protein [Chitinophaga nivalis]MCW3482983.1 TonB-dependent receptor plug domain-containing protein [Chitinophaga nivalis]